MDDRKNTRISFVAEEKEQKKMNSNKIHFKQKYSSRFDGVEPPRIVGPVRRRLIVEK